MEVLLLLLPQAHPIDDLGEHLEKRLAVWPQEPVSSPPFLPPSLPPSLPGNAGHQTWSDRTPAGVHHGALGEDAGGTAALLPSSGGRREPGQLPALHC